MLSRAHPLKDPGKSWKEALDGPLIAYDDWSMEAERAEYFVDILIWTKSPANRQTCGRKRYRISSLTRMRTG